MIVEDAHVVMTRGSKSVHNAGGPSVWLWLFRLEGFHLILVTQSTRLFRLLLDALDLGDLVFELGLTSFVPASKDARLCRRAKNRRRYVRRPTGASSSYPPSPQFRYNIHGLRNSSMYGGGAHNPSRYGEGER